MDNPAAMEKLMDIQGVPELMGAVFILGVLLGILFGVFVSWLCITIMMGRMRSRVAQTWHMVGQMHTNVSLPDGHGD